jgi:hypothetical protein
LNIQNSVCQKPSSLTDLRLKAGRDGLNVPQGWREIDRYGGRWGRTLSSRRGAHEPSSFSALARLREQTAGVISAAFQTPPAPSGRFLFVDRKMKLDAAGQFDRAQPTPARSTPSAPSARATAAPSGSTSTSCRRGPAATYSTGRWRARTSTCVPASPGSPKTMARCSPCSGGAPPDPYPDSGVTSNRGRG